MENKYNFVFLLKKNIKNYIYIVGILNAYHKIPNLININNKRSKKNGTNKIRIYLAGWI